jgi:hypothetical protein
MEEDIQQIRKEIAALKQQLSIQGQATNYGVELMNISGSFEVVTIAPTAAPVSVYEQVKLYYDSSGPTMQLYIYDNVNAKWNYVALTIV